ASIGDGCQFSNGRSFAAWHPYPLPRSSKVLLTRPPLAATLLAGWAINGRRISIVGLIRINVQIIRKNYTAIDSIE
ncbi:hypothetical protein, partial [Ruegeria arenilitoris]|uniref:hypothetical protein n=1 Tax=Ruegeria arenilitoris TaxID=1173585 RepID=UPI001C2C7C7F